MLYILEEQDEVKWQQVFAGPKVRRDDPAISVPPPILSLPDP
jgi:hypothetical protein